ncbi:hypothetical protein J6590_088408 [Homalodisca vitripennis]|nr:hypothetical protein J6590_088408 [Homalodisca vitripennis]
MANFLFRPKKLREINGNELNGKCLQVYSELMLHELMSDLLHAICGVRVYDCRGREHVLESLVRVSSHELHHCSSAMIYRVEVREKSFYKAANPQNLSPNR